MTDSIQQANSCAAQNKQLEELRTGIKHDFETKTSQSEKTQNVLWAKLVKAMNTSGSCTAKVKDTLRTIDGIDEFATLAGAALSPLGQAVMLLSVVGVGLPFVALGAQGAIEESMDLFREQFPVMVINLLEQCSDIINEMERENISPDTLKAMQPIKDILEAMKVISPGLSESTLKNELEPRDTLNSLKDKGITEKNILAALESFSTLSDSCKNQYQHNSVAMHKIANFQRDIRELPSKLIERNFSPLAAIAMTGMTGGMVVLGAKSIADIISSTGGAGIAENATIAGSGLSTAAGAVFLPAQAAMIGYAIGCAVHGEMRDKNMKKDLVILFDLKEEYSKMPFQPETISYMHDHLVQQRDYNKQHSSIYGYVTTFGQSLMLASTICTLSGAGIVVAIPLAAIGAPCTMWAAISRAVNKNKEEKFLGTKVSNSARAAHEKLIEKINKKENAMPYIEEEINTQRSLLIESKIYSIIDNALKKARKKMSNPTAEYLETKVSAKIDRLIKHKESLFRRSHTTLLKSDLVMMPGLFDKNYRGDFFKGDINQIQNNLDEKIRQDWDSSQLMLSDDRAKKIRKQAVKELKKVTHHHDKSANNPANAADFFTKNTISTNESQQSGNESTKNDVISHIIAKNIGKQLKTDSKFRLHGAINQFFSSREVKITSTVTEQVPDNTTPSTGSTMPISGDTGEKVLNSPGIMPDTAINTVLDKNDILTASGIPSLGKENVHAEHVMNRQSTSAVTNSSKTSSSIAPSDDSIDPHVNFKSEQTTSTVTGPAQTSFDVMQNRKVSSDINDRIKKLNQRIEVKNKILQEQTELRQREVYRDTRQFSVEK